MSGLGEGAATNTGGNPGGAGAGTQDGGAGNGSQNNGGAGSGGAGNSGGGTSKDGLGTGDKGGGAGAGGQGTASWRDALPDELKSDPTLNKYSDLNNLAKAHIELQKKIGEKGIFKPKAGASPEEIKAFREAMGIPTDASKYELAFDDKAGVSPEMLAWAKEQGAKRGIDPSELKGFMEDYMKKDIENETALDVALQEDTKAGLEKLRSEWGEGFDRNIQRANFAAEKLGGKDLVARLVEFGAQNDPLILKAFSEAAKLFGEDRLREGGIGEGRMTPGELDGRIAEVQKRLFSMKHTDGAYLSTKNEYESLWKQKTGGK